MTTDPAGYATPWYFAPTPDQPWDLAVQQVVASLEQRPDAHWRAGEGLRGESLLEVWFPIGPWLFQGSYAPRPPCLGIRICDARAATEAWTTWFLPQLPAHVTSVVFNTEDGVENGYADVDFVLACRDGRDAVVDTLTDHLRHVWRAGGTSPPPRADD
ncbi:hypothetical protein [Embleya hyalina]|uniref:Uncharacterized protein n=1 Tax=Embleya hyalina TaxID=516124 RepID=A0A401YWY3_9ACTN|nr:hypothetical protein [Embleya hyalina]GCD99106.1 hypothetical protein EHYA_06818 [Embleya hyalina]